MNRPDTTSDDSSPLFDVGDVEMAFCNSSGSLSKRLQEIPGMSHSSVPQGKKPNPVTIVQSSAHIMYTDTLHIGRPSATCTLMNTGTAMAASPKGHHGDPSAQHERGAGWGCEGYLGHGVGLRVCPECRATVTGRSAFLVGAMIVCS